MIKALTFYAIFECILEVCHSPILINPFILIIKTLAFIMEGGSGLILGHLNLDVWEESGRNKRYFNERASLQYESRLF